MKSSKITKLFMLVVERFLVYLYSKNLINLHVNENNIN